jgi:hypothetical protein
MREDTSVNTVEINESSQKAHSLRFSTDMKPIEYA